MLLSYGSIKGLFAIYAVHLAYEHQLTFTLANLESNANFLTQDYTQGFLVATGSFGLFTLRTLEEPYEITFVNETIKNNIKAKVYAAAESEKQSTQSVYLYDQLRRLEYAFKIADKRNTPNDNIDEAEIMQDDIPMGRAKKPRKATQATESVGKDVKRATRKSKAKLSEDSISAKLSDIE
nr:hypothetical protein [Pedobacter kyonggii]